MKEFQTVKLIFNDFKIFEIKELKRRISNVASSIDSSNVTSSYINLLANRVDLSSESIQYKLYNKLNNVAFRKLNQRLLNKMFDILSSKDLVELNDQYDDRAKEIFLLEKKLMLVDLLRYRGLFSVSNELLDQIISTVKLYENYEILIYALQKKRLRLPGTDSIFQKDLIDKEIIKYQKYSLTLSYVKKIYTDLILMHTKNEEKGIFIEYRKGLRKLENLGSRTDSLTIKFYISMLESQYMSMKGNDDDAANVLLKLIDTISNSLIFTKNRYGTILLNIALYKRNCFNLSESEIYLNEASKYLSRIDETRNVLYYQQSVFYYIKGDLDKSQYFTKLITTSVTDKMEVNLRHRIYCMYILLLFAQGNLKECILHLEKFKSKKGVDGSIDFEMKLLQIMCLIDLEMFDKADKFLDSLRKHLHYKVHIQTFHFSAKKLLSILQSLKVVGYNFEQLNKKEMENFEKFSDGYRLIGDYLIPFTSWFKSKLKNVPYDHSAAMREMRKKYKAEKKETVLA